MKQSFTMITFKGRMFFFEILVFCRASLEVLDVRRLHIGVNNEICIGGGHYFVLMNEFSRYLLLVAEAFEERELLSVCEIGVLG